MNIQRHILRIVLFCCIPIMSGVHAANNIEVKALFKDKAMVMIDNEQQLLKVGEPVKCRCQAN